MPKVSCVGKVESDGRLSIPKEKLDELKLQVGQEVEIVMRTPDDAYAPLRKLIGLAQTGRTDASVNHDQYLYGKKEA